MIKQVAPDQLQQLYEIINDGARVYQGVIPADCWHEPYMSLEELQGELAAGVEFWGWEENGRLLGVMGRQDRGDGLSHPSRLCAPDLPTAGDRQQTAGLFTSRP